MRTGRPKGPGQRTLQGTPQTVPELDRRDFNKLLLSVTAGFAAGDLLAATSQETLPASVVAGLTIGVQSYTYRAFSLERMIESMQSVGLTAVELWTGHLDPAIHDEADFQATRSKLDAAGIAVSAYCVNFRPEAPDELLDRAFAGAGILGTKLMTTSTEKAIVPKLDEWCQKYDVTIGLHNHRLDDAWFKGDRAQNFGGPDDWAEALEGRSERIAINLDIGHFSAAGYDPVSFFRQHHERIMGLHIKDRDSDPEHSYRRFGQGTTPIAGVLELARDLRFPGVVSLEYEIEEEDPTEAVRHAYRYVRDVLLRDT